MIHVVHSLVFNRLRIQVISIKPYSIAALSSPAIIPVRPAVSSWWRDAPQRRGRSAQARAAISPALHAGPDELKDIAFTFC